MTVGARLLLALSQELNVSGGGMDVQHRATTVQISFGKDFPRSDAPGPGNLQLRKIAANAVTPRNLDRSAHGDAKPVRHVDDDVAHGSFQAGIDEIGAPRQGCNDRSAACFST